VVHGQRDGQADNAGAGSTDYLHMFGLCALGYMWVKMAAAAQANLKPRQRRTASMSARLVTGPLLHERVTAGDGGTALPHQAGAASTMELPDEMF